MKKIALLIAFACSTSAIFSQTLFTYGNNAVDKEEFLRAYNKNKTPVTDKEKALREYLDLYTKFKLKVSAALELKLDTLPQLQYDLQSFRTQIEESYLNNEKAMNDLLTEAFNRSQKDVHVLHFFVPADTSQNADAVEKANKSATALYASLNSGKTEYDKMIGAEQASKARYSDLGYVTAFTLPYEYENIVYGLRPGQVSKPYRTKNGWHVFKVVEERKAAGKWRIAQILMATPPDMSPEAMKQLEKKADSIYQLLQKGADFTTLARQFSDDKLTYVNGGEMPEFGTGKFDLPFEKEVFKLTRDGEISKPFLTPYGYHIVKRLGQTPISSDRNDNAFLFDLKQKVQQDARVNGSKDIFVREVSKQVGFKKTGAVTDADMYRYADSVIANPSQGTDIYPISSKTIYTFSKSKVTGRDWLDFIRNYKGNPELYQGENNAALTEKFISSATLDYYKKHLEEFNQEFRYQMQEFKEGNVLFEIMERNVWGNASNDTVGLVKYYNENKGKYLWSPSANMILFNCSNKTVADAAKASLLGGKDWRKIVEEANNTIQADSGRFELSQLPLKMDSKLSAGAVTDIAVNAQDGTAGFAKVLKLYDANIQRSFDEAKGLVINDYQNILEEKWINELRKKYPVKINEAVFQSLLK